MVVEVTIGTEINLLYSSIQFLRLVPVGNLYLYLELNRALICNVLCFEYISNSFLKFHLVLQVPSSGRSGICWHFTTKNEETGSKGWEI